MQERLISETQDLVDVAEAQRLRRLARAVPIVDTLTDEEKLHALRPSTGMALALTLKQVYAGTVTGAEKADRRAKGKRQRKNRKLHRGNR